MGKRKRPVTYDVQQPEEAGDLHSQLNGSQDDTIEDILNHSDLLERNKLVSQLNQNGHRLVITHIEVENFKSYYGRVVLGPFHKNFTAIIGANGSGKSNVIDSLLFVFGYRASKIRSKKLSVLIHSSAGHDDIDFCRVTVFFQKIVDKPDNEKRSDFDIVEGSGFSISRKAFQDNSSKYSINRRPSTFKNVANLLNENGIDLTHNRFLILQGEVEQISQMKPKARTENEEGMLEYLEDIIGSSRLKSPIARLQELLDTVNEQRSNQIQRVNFAEKERNNLERPAINCLIAMRLENAITSLNNKILSHEIITYKDKLFGLEETAGNTRDEIEGCKEKAAEIQENSEKTAKERDRYQRHIDKCQESLQRIAKEINDQYLVISKSQSDQKRFKKRLEELERNLQNEAEKIKELESAPDRARHKIEELKISLKQVENEITENNLLLKNKLPEVESQTASLNDKKKGLEEHLGKYLEDENEISSKLIVAQESVANLNRGFENENRKYFSYKDKHLELTENLERKERELNAMNTGLQRLPPLEDLRNNIKQLRDEEARLVETVRKLRAEYEEKKQQNESNQSNNRLISALMREKAHGRISGILGRLGDLGAIDERYDVAISTTCPALDNIVVADVNTCEKCIQFLKKENLGLATFIALDKQKHSWPRINNRPATPENAPRLIDLVRVADKQILPAFYYALNDTLVADDISSATRIAIGGTGKRWRTVTLKGEVVEATGAMTGGGSQQKKGKIGQTVRVSTGASAILEQLSQLENHLNSSENELLEVRQNLSRADSEHTNQEGEVARLERNIKEIELDRNRLNQLLSSLSDQIQAQENRVKEAEPDAQELDRLKKEIEKYSEGNSKLAEKTDTLRMELIAVNEEIEKVSHQIVGKIKQDLANSKQQSEELERSIAKENGIIISSGRQLSKSRAHLKNLEHDTHEVDSQLSECGNKILAAEQQKHKLDEDKAKKQDELIELEDGLKEVIGQNQEKSDEEIELYRRIDELKRNLSKISEQMAHLNSKCKTISEKISKLRLYRVDLFVAREATSGDDAANCSNPRDGAAASSSDKEKRGLLVLPADDLDQYMDTDRNGVVEEDSQFDRAEEDEQQMEVDDANEDGHNSIPKLNNRDELFVCLIKSLDAEAVRNFDMDEITASLSSLRKRRSPHVQIDLPLLADYNEKAERFNKESKELVHLTQKLDKHRSAYNKLKKQRLHEFMHGFRKISESVKVFYQLITLQGDASLDLVDSLDPFSEGISFTVRPPKKSWKHIGNLSGGEKTLASLSLVFGLHSYRPSPLYVMDEIDASLDFRNVSVISNYVLERTLNAQFIVISLRNQMFERANRLVGIYKIYDCTHNVVVDPAAIQEQYEEDSKLVKKLRRHLHNTLTTNELE